MDEHRIRLTDQDMELIAASLRARLAMATGVRRHRIERLVERLSECVPGNPQWIFEAGAQRHEEAAAAAADR